MTSLQASGGLIGPGGRPAMGRAIEGLPRGGAARSSTSTSQDAASEYCGASWTNRCGEAARRVTVSASSSLSAWVPWRLDFVARQDPGAIVSGDESGCWGDRGRVRRRGVPRCAVERLKKGMLCLP